MNILYCGDSNIADGVVMSVLSLLDNAKEPLNIYVLTAGVESNAGVCRPLTSDFEAFLLAEVKKKSPRSSVTLTDISDRLKNELPTANMKTRFTPCCMLRLFADTVSEIPDKILYLDNDVVCRSDPSDLYYTDVSGCDLCGVLDNYGGWLFYCGHVKRNYINSGVLLLNMARIRENRLFERCRALCRDKKMFMPDQSALNKLSSSKMLCERKYNEQKKERENTVFRHFTTSFKFFPIFRKISVKPWDEMGMHEILKTHEYDRLISEYKRLKMSSDDFTKEITL